MVRTNTVLVSTLALCSYGVAPTLGFTTETPRNRLSHVRLDLEVGESSSCALSIESTHQPLSQIRVVDDDEINTAQISSELPPVLQQITDERKNFQVNLGKAMDTLRKDMPYILKEAPGKSIAAPLLPNVHDRGAFRISLEPSEIHSVLSHTSYFVLKLVQTTVFITKR